MGAEYANTYGLTTRAFESAPDPQFHFSSLTQRKAMSAVSYALSRGSGIAVLTGAEGTGKSSLLAQLAEQLGGQPVTLAMLASAPGSVAGRIAEAFGLVASEEDSHAFSAIEAFLIEEMRRGKRALLLIDDAGHLPGTSASDLASLAGLRHGERSLVQIVLTGDENFARRLAEDAWANVREFTMATHSFEPLQRNEIEPYLRHRLGQAGWEGNPALGSGLAQLLHEATGGVPAAVNRAMSALLDDAAEAGADVIEGDALAAWLDIEMTEAEYELVEPEPKPEPPFEPEPQYQPEPMPEVEDQPEPTLAEEQIAAIEHAFAEHDRLIGTLRREIAELREPTPAPPAASDERLDVIEERLDQHDQALRHMLERLIAFFERTGPDAR